MEQDTRTPRLDDLAQVLELRWRLRFLLEAAVNALVIAIGASILLLVVDALLLATLPVYGVLLGLVLASTVTALIVAGVHRRDPIQFLIDADRHYALKSLLASGLAFGTDGGDSQDLASGFRQVVIRRAEAATDSVEPHEVYPWITPKRTGVLAALAVALGVLFVLDASGWFERSAPPYIAEALLLEDLGERLAERAADDEELEDLASELLQLGRDAREGNLTPDEARPRIDELSERIEEQISNLDRTPPLANDEDAQIPPETAESIRSALQSGMGENEIEELYLRMRSDGNTVPEIVEALEEASPDMAPNANLDVDEDRVQELLDQLNAAQSEPTTEMPDDLAEELDESRRVLQQMGAGLELQEGQEEQIGERQGQGSPFGPGDEQAGESREPGEEGDLEGGLEGGDREVDDTFQDDFARPEDGSRVFRELQGIVTDNTVLDLLIRELPSEATSVLTEEERSVVFDQVIEEAVNREQTPPELQRLVRNYFLRLTLANEEGTDE